MFENNVGYLDARSVEYWKAVMDRGKTHEAAARNLSMELAKFPIPLDAKKQFVSDYRRLWDDIENGSIEYPCSNVSGYVTKGTKLVWVGYNEPVVDVLGDACKKQDKIAKRIAKAIRKVM